MFVLVLLLVDLLLFLGCMIFIDLPFFEGVAYVIILYIFLLAFISVSVIIVFWVLSKMCFYIKILSIVVWKWSCIVIKVLGRVVCFFLDATEFRYFAFILLVLLTELALIRAGLYPDLYERFWILIEFYIPYRDQWVYNFLFKPFRVIDLTRSFKWLLNRFHFLVVVLWVLFIWWP